MQMNLRLRIETPETTSKPGLPVIPGSSMEETYLLSMRCPVYRRRDSGLGFRMELVNLVCDVKGKGTNGCTVRLKVLMRKPGADCSVVAMPWGNAHGAKGAGHLRRNHNESTGNRRNSLVLTEGGSLQWVARAG